MCPLIVQGRTMRVLRSGVVFGLISAAVVIGMASGAAAQEDPPVAPVGTVEFTVVPPDFTNKTSADFAFEASGPTTCQLDGGEIWECAGPITIPDLKDGSHSLTVASSDGASITHDWTVDTVKPTVNFRSTIRKVGNKVPYTNETSASFTFSTSDSTAELTCLMPATIRYMYHDLPDGRQGRIPLPSGTWAPCPPSPHTLSDLSEGDHWVRVRAVDRAGNYGYGDLHWRVDYEYVPPDTTPPVVTMGLPEEIDPFTYEIPFAVSEQASLVCRLTAGSLTQPSFSRTLENCGSPISWTDIPEGKVEVRVEATDPSGNRSSFGRGWTVDRTPPEVLIGSAPAATTGSTAIFRFSSSETAGRQTFECSLDDGSWAPCASPVELSALADGSHAFSIRATDGHGNTSDPKVVEWSADTVAPEARITSGPDTSTSSTIASFAIETTGDAALLECSLDDGEWEPCESANLLTGIAEGPHVFRARATDAIGNAGPVAVFEWTVDTTGPEVKLTTKPGDPSPFPTARFAWNSEPMATFLCRLDSREWSACVSPTTLSSLSDGSHTFEVKGFDPLGNEGPAAIHTWTTANLPPDSNGSAPTVSITSGPAGRTASRTAEFVIEHTPGTTLSCRSTVLGFIFSRAWKPCRSPIALAGFQDGNQFFEVMAIDPEGRVSAPQAWSWRVDTIAPPVTITASPLPTTVTTLASFSFGSSDREATFECSLDSGPWAPCASPVERAGLAVGQHTFEVVAIDFVGNRSAPVLHAWEIVTPNPDYTIFGEPDSTTTPITNPEPDPEPRPEPEQPEPDPLSEDDPGQGDDPAPTVLQPKALLAPRILSAPARTASRRPSFRLSVPEAGTENLCSVGRTRPVPCGTVWKPSAKLAPGRHLFTVVSKASDGRLTAPVTRRFSVLGPR
jgi:hypothetical protein